MLKTYHFAQPFRVGRLQSMLTAGRQFCKESDAGGGLTLCWLCRRLPPAHIRPQASPSSHFHLIGGQLVLDFDDAEKRLKDVESLGSTVAAF